METFEEYHEQASVTNTGCSLNYLTLGLAGEAGEVANKVKKIERDDKGHVSLERRADILDECGDLLWYLDQLVAALDSDLDEVSQVNINKLRSRQKRNAIHGSGDKR